MIEMVFIQRDVEEGKNDLAPTSRQEGKVAGGRRNGKKAV